MSFSEWDTVRVTGKIISEKGEPRVERLLGVVATVYPEGHKDHDYFKVWPKNDKDPQLPVGHDSKLWFQRSEATVELVEVAYP